VVRQAPAKAISAAEVFRTFAVGLAWSMVCERAVVVGSGVYSRVSMVRGVVEVTGWEGRTVVTSSEVRKLAVSALRSY
jgi:hypothetical protein